MAQSVEELNCSQSETQHGDNESAAYQTDFSVTNRLLPPYNNGSNNPSNLTGNIPSVTISYRNGQDTYQQQQQSHHPVVPNSLPAWQNLLPNDQGGLPMRTYPHGWRNSVPNASLQLAQHGGSSNLYQATGAASYNSPAAYMPSAGVHSVNASPDSSTAPYGERCGKENTSLSNGGAGLTTGDRNVIKGYCQQVIKTELGEVDSDGGDESNDDSSNHSSQGEAESLIDEPKKAKRTRTAFSNLQLDQLELAFSRSHYPDVFTREDLSNKLNIREDRIQVWFQNRRARYRKQERTGSVSLRSKYRQKRLQKLQQNQVAAATAGMYSYYPSCGTTNHAQAMLTSPQPVSPYVPGFAFPPNYIPSSSGGMTAGVATSDGLMTIPNAVTSPGYLPIKGSIPLPASYMGLNQPGTPAYGTYGTPTAAGMIATSIAQK